MVSFYENIKSGASKDEALRQAKLQFIERYDNMEVHPFYWSSFITIGDMDMIDSERFSQPISLLWPIFAIVLFAVLSYLYFDPRIKTKISSMFS